MSMGLVWITGAAGFIGRHLAKRLAASGHRVIGIGHGTWPDAPNWGVSRWLNGDIAEGNLGRLSTDEGTPTAVFHLAGGSSVGASIASPREDFARTVETTATLCDWLVREAPTARLTAVSSAAIYGAGHVGPIAEDAIARPFSPYGYHKLMMEQVCHSYSDTFGLQAVIARLFSVYGQGLRKQLLWDVSERLALVPGVLDLGGSGRELRDWTHVSDVVRCLELLSPLASSAVPIMNVGTGAGTDVAQVANFLNREFGSRAILRFTGEGRVGDPQSLIADNSRLAELGFDWQVPLSEGIAEYAAWKRAVMNAPS